MVEDDGFGFGLELRSLAMVSKGVIDGFCFLAGISRGHHCCGLSSCSSWIYFQRDIG